MVATRENFPLLAELLAEQQRLDTPVARFSSAHDAASVSQLSTLTSQLIPLSKPKPGEQYAFEVDLDSCTGCKSCVAACHSLNGLDDTETWRDVGVLVSPRRAHSFTQTITTACHHCADPACLNGCPVLAYEKDPVTGIVLHLDDQCIGCSYCVLKCPYDVPKFSTRLGIVRKCDMCHSRLAEGEAPACAQACPTHAIRIVTVATAENRKPEAGDRMAAEVSLSYNQSSVSGIRFPVSGFSAPVSGFLPGAPDPDYTQPTTRYVTKRQLPANLIAGDAATLRVQPAHWPLVIMLTLVPAAVGLSVLAALAPTSTYDIKHGALALGGAGLVASVFHLGQPLRAWRIFLGWRKSWLSREAMVLGAWFAVVTVSVFSSALTTASAVLGVIGLGCSAMVYVDTHRHFWRWTQTAPRFLGTAALVALAVVVPASAGLLLIGKLAWESRTFFDRSVSARLQRGPLASAVALRDILGLTAVVFLITAPGWPALALLLAGELAERYLFFRAVDAPKMPGVAA
jgi:formate dehydrogenase iron-sulfur subunit